MSNPDLKWGFLVQKDHHRALWSACRARYGWYRRLRSERVLCDYGYLTPVNLLWRQRTAQEFSVLNSQGSSAKKKARTHARANTIDEHEAAERSGRWPCPSHAPGGHDGMATVDEGTEF